MKIKLLALFLLAAIAGRGQTMPDMSWSNRHRDTETVITLTLQSGEHFSWSGTKKDGPADFILALFIDSLFRRTLQLEKKVDSLEQFTRDALWAAPFHELRRVKTSTLVPF